VERRWNDPIELRNQEWPALRIAGIDGLYWQSGFHEGRKRVRAAALVILILVTACRDEREDLPFFRSSALTPEWLSRREASAPSMHRVASFTSVDQTGATLTERALTDKVTIAHFFFTECGDICPVTTGRIKHLLKEMPSSSLQVISYSVRPVHDSIAAVVRFASKHDITDKRWHFVSATPQTIQRLARDSYFVRLGADTTYGVKSIAHTETLVLVDGHARLRGVYAGTLPLEMERLREDAEVLLRSQ
jgi:protein SCO1/2